MRHNCLSRLELTTLVVTLVALSCLSRVSAEVPQRSLETARVEAKTKGLPILLEFDSVTCPDSARFTQLIKNEPRLQDAFRQVVVVRIDVASRKGRSFQQSFNANGTPSFVLLDEHGEPCDQWLGLLPEEFPVVLGDALRDRTSIREKELRFRTHPTASLAATLGRIRVGQMRLTEAIDFMRNARASGTEASPYERVLWAYALAFLPAEQSVPFDDLMGATIDVIAITPPKNAERLWMPLALLAHAKLSEEVVRARALSQNALDTMPASIDPRILAWETALNKALADPAASKRRIVPNNPAAETRTAND